MFEIRKYKIGFNIWGLILFLIIMLPNFIWFAVPALNDILRNVSVTPAIDLIASIFQVIMVVALCLFQNKECQKPMNKISAIGITITIFLYYVGWILYYAGFVNAVIVLDLCVAPCVAFVIFAVTRKNVIALISAIVFMICHLIYGIVNFVI